MENSEFSNLDKIIAAIEHECACEVEKIKQEAQEKYQKHKDECIKEIQKQLKQEYEKNIQDLNKRRIAEENKIKKVVREKYEYAKMLKLQTIVEEIQLLLKKERLCKKLFIKTLDKLGISRSENKGYIAFCNDEDRWNIEKHFGGVVRSMPPIGLGGIVICSKNGKIICDNSFQTRLNVFLKLHLKDIKKHIF